MDVQIDLTKLRTAKPVEEMKAGKGKAGARQHDHFWNALPKWWFIVKLWFNGALC